MPEQPLNIAWQASVASAGRTFAEATPPAAAKTPSTAADMSTADLRNIWMFPFCRECPLWASCPSPMEVLLQPRTGDFWGEFDTRLEVWLLHWLQREVVRRTVTIHHTRLEFVDGPADDLDPDRILGQDLARDRLALGDELSEISTRQFLDGV